ncbi:hypothetical protein WJX72_002206 [[Myrmecia] bisecta]|uniref:S-adenosyl-L-methionine-dependent methyltransferase n=1 Tax=[Myrmecia] bisecta TaxID=41462 RepID=A0AAW1R4T2_9CHLO
MGRGMEDEPAILFKSTEQEVDGVKGSSELQVAASTGPRTRPQHASNPKQFSKGSRRGGLLRGLTFWWPTNYSMLLFRTINRDMDLPNHNDDHVAQLLSSHLMPIRARITQCMPGSLTAWKRTVEHPKRGTPGVCNFVDARTKWFDQAVRMAIEEGISQVVIIAAGFDTRAYRMHAPGVKFFEIDLPHASAKKQSLIEKVLKDATKYPRPEYIAADLSCISLARALSTSSYEPAQKTIFTCEGLLYYLPQGAAHRLMADVGQLSLPGSRFLFDFLHLDVLQGTSNPCAYACTAKSVANKGEPFVSGMQPTPAAVRAFFWPHGFDLSELLGPREMAAHMLPHLVWDQEVPPILSFFSFAEGTKLASSDRE